MDGIANLQTRRHTEQNKVNSVPRLLSNQRQFSAHFTYSNSIVPGGLLVKSYITRLTPRTSLIILDITLFNTS